MDSPEARVIETLFNIPTKEGVRVPFRLNDAQRFFDHHDNPTRSRIIVAKARQKGFSSIILAKLGVRCLGKEGTRAVCISHEASSTQRLLDKVGYYIRHINGPAPVFGRHSRMEMYFPKTESTYYIGTAGAKAFGRGDTITDLHCSEYAFWENPEVHSAGLFQTVPLNSGRIYIESTGNGRNNDFYYIWQHAEDMGYTRIFYAWHMDTEYTLPLPLGKMSWKPDTPRHNAYLLELRDKYKLSDEQMYWYEIKLRELREDLALTQQEYPSEPEECFQATGGSVFTNVELTADSRWVHTTLDGRYAMRLQGHPATKLHYVIGADPSGGTGHDDAAINIFCVETRQQVYEFFNNHTNPYEFAQYLAQLGYQYNDAFIVCESNNHGAAVIPILKEHYKKECIYKRSYGTKSTQPQYGWMNSESTKHSMVGMLQEALNELTLYGIQTVKELKGYEESKEGKLGGDSDNLVIATGLAVLGLRKFEYLYREYNTPNIKVVDKKHDNYMYYTFDDMIKRLPGGQVRRR